MIAAHSKVGNTSVGAFKEAMSHFPTGVTVVTSRRGDEVYGTTVSAFASLSLNPCLVLVSLYRAGPLISFIAEARRLGVSILSASQEAVSRYFATPDRGPSRDDFPGIATVSGRTGAPLIAGSVAMFDCRLSQMYDTGDHMAVIAEVVDVDVPSGEPLVHCRRRFSGLASADASADRTGMEEPRHDDRHG